MLARLPLSAFAVAVLAAAAQAAGAQSQPPSSLRNSAIGAPGSSFGTAAPAKPLLVPATRVAPVAKPAAPLNPAVLAPAARVTAPAAVAPIAAAGKQQVLPDNLLSMDDRAIIIVSGKQKQAGDLKRELGAELQRLSGPAKTMRTASRKHLILPAQGLDSAAARTPSGARISGAATTLKNSRGALTGGLSYTELKNYCRDHPPEIKQVRGALTPNQRFRIEGECFGEATGAVQVIGQFPGGNMKLVFERWTDGEIVAFVPAVHGAADHAVALTVVRSDKKPTAAAQASFIAARERIEVPGHFWTPGQNFDRTDTANGGGNIFTSYTVHSASSGSHSTPFALTINKACALDSASWTSSVGRVDALNGWDDGAPHEARVNIVWTPTCTTRTNNYVFASDSQRVCRIAFSVKAWAMCPIGVAP